MNRNLLSTEKSPCRVGNKVAANDLGHLFQESMDPRNRLGASDTRVDKDGLIFLESKTPLTAYDGSKPLFLVKVTDSESTLTVMGHDQIGWSSRHATLGEVRPEVPASQPCRRL